MLFWEPSFPLHLIFNNPSNQSKVSNLSSMESVQYQILISNFLSKNKNLDSLDIDEKTFLLLLNSYLKINLPHVMFEYLKMTLISFYEGNSCFIRYGHVLSELFIQQVVQKIMVEATSQFWGGKLKIPEAMKVIEPFKVNVVTLDGSSLLMFNFCSFCVYLLLFCTLSFSFNKILSIFASFCCFF